MKFKSINFRWTPADRTFTADLSALNATPETLLHVIGNTERFGIEVCSAKFQCDVSFFLRRIDWDEHNAVSMWGFVMDPKAPVDPSLKDIVCLVYNR